MAQRATCATIGLLAVLAGGCERATAPPDAAHGPPAGARPAGLQRLDPPASRGALAPNLGLSAGGVLLSWLEPDATAAEGHRLVLAELVGDEWTQPTLIHAGTDFFANWADLPVVVEDRTRRVATWLSKLGADTYAYGVRAAQAPTADGAVWEDLGLLHDDATPAEHGFVSLLALPDGSVRAFWLDGREMPGGGSMELRSAELGVAIGASERLDGRVCECCATDAALASGGPVVAFRDRSEQEIRDIAVVRATADGWSEPALVHSDDWRIPGCPVNGPAIAASGDEVAVAWFTGAEPARVAVAFSADGGASFGEPVVVDDQGPLGRVDLAMGEGGAAYVSWLAAAGGRPEIRLLRVESSGARGESVLVAGTSAKRSAGVPRLVRRGDRLVVAWVDDLEPSSLRVARLPLP